MRLYLLHIIILSALFSCEGTDIIFISEPNQDLDNCNNTIITSGKYYEKDGKQFLWAGEDSTTHFNVTDWSLNACQLDHGFGRESFHALINPDYESLNEAHAAMDESSSVVVLNTGSEIKAYPYDIIINYELINEEVNGDPVMIVYCYLANLAAVYTREYCGQTLTFGVSGYTYHDPNFEDFVTSDPEISVRPESFILWDRNSESLWWPIMDRSVSGTFQDERMIKYNINKWSVITMKELKENYPDAKVLMKNQVLKDIGEISPANGCD